MLDALGGEREAVGTRQRGVLRGSWRVDVLFAWGCEPRALARRVVSSVTIARARDPKQASIHAARARRSWSEVQRGRELRWRTGAWKEESAQTGRIVVMSTDSAAESGRRMDALRSSPIARMNGLLVSEHFLSVPLDHSKAEDPSATRIQLFAREIRSESTAAIADTGENRALLYLNGGPGYECSRVSSNGGFLRALFEHGKYSRIVLLDQRGTGCSTALSASSITALGTTEQQLAVLVHFRADSIVRDAELLRCALLGADSQWAVLGQSFGGFCALTYLSLFPQSLTHVLLTGGVPPIRLNESGCTADEVYNHLLRRNARQMSRFYDLFPADAAILQRVVAHLHAADPPLLTPLGNAMTPRLFQTIGLRLLGFAGGFARLHFLLERAFEQPIFPSSEGSVTLSDFFLRELDALEPFACNPLYALLHEACYADGGNEATRWSAARIRSELAPLFETSSECSTSPRTQQPPVMLTGEQVYPFHFEDVAALRPLKPLAEALAEYSTWGQLYDRRKLSECCVPIVAAVYENDMYVDIELSERTLKSILNPNSVKVLHSNAYTHGALRETPDELISRMFALLRATQSAPPPEAL